ncbi:hypothetical protein VTN49DRAFT_1137 [Thermomyces lanuginosus]|uniref:uncharacterized protein n=1 Tax=Thermomyces lanuginosus TaxID=5541 RepID=UPI0037444468
MRFFLIVTATLNLLASSALSQSTPSSFADWIDDSFSPSCVAECLKDSYENALGGDCGENAVSSRDEDTINCICQKFIDVDFSSDVMDGLLDCEIDRCDISSFDPGDSMPNGTEFPGLDSLCPDVFKGSGPVRSGDESLIGSSSDSSSDDDNDDEDDDNNNGDDGDDGDVAPLTKANLFSAAGAALLVGAYLL